MFRGRKYNRKLTLNEIFFCDNFHHNTHTFVEKILERNNKLVSAWEICKIAEIQKQAARLYAMYIMYK